MLNKPEHFDDLRAWKGEIPLSYVYTAGVAGEKFLRSIKDSGRIVGTRCKKCSVTYVPPRIYCERCFQNLSEWVEVGRHGTVHSYTTVWLGLDGQRLERPDIVAFVKLQGTSGGLVHRLGEIGPADVRIGMEVEAIFKAKKDRTGSVLDIRYFRPMKTSRA